jgi:hypothetical protein
LLQFHFNHETGHHPLNFFPYPEVNMGLS